jgi:hypothetical protein
MNATTSRNGATIDWEFWRLRSYVKDWEAAALSIGLDPDAMQHHPQAWMAGTPEPLFLDQSFTNGEQKRQFHKRYRLVTDWVREHGDKVRHYNASEVNLRYFAAWIVANDLKSPPEFAALATEKQAVTAPADVGPVDADAELAALFDPVGAAQLEKMFPSAKIESEGRWKDWVERANRNGLKDAAKEDRALFNPYYAAKWWLREKKPDGWDLARCNRVLAKNLPARSVDKKQMVTGELD